MAQRALLRAVPALLMAVQPAPAPVPQTPAGTPYGEEAAIALLERLGARSAVYERAILRFACTETLLEEEVVAETGEARSSHETTYRYLLQAEGERAGVSEYRQVLAREGVPVRSSPEQVQAPGPPPFLWATLFDGANRSLFHFRVLDTEKRGVTDTVMIAFEGALGFEAGRRLAEWSGRVWIDRDRFNPVHIEAEPARQEAALAMQLEEYRRAFRLGSLRLRPKPKAYSLTVEFLESRYGLTFPTQAMWRQQVLDARARRRTARLVRQQFSDYRFFDVRMEETMEEREPPGD